MNESLHHYTSYTNVSTESTVNCKMGNYVSSVEEISELQAFSDWYKPIHGYLASIVCVFGVIANILNIIVLTRKNMQSSTNIILTGLAISDGLTMAAYFPFALQLYIINGVDAHPSRDTRDLARFQMGYAIFSVIVHSISIWLTVTLAVFRFIFIRFPRRGARFCNLQRAKIAVVTVVIVVSVVCIPNSLNYTIQTTPYVPNRDGNCSNGTIWYINVKRGTPIDNFVNKFNFWIQAIFVKLLPCVLLTIFSILLVRTMRAAENRRKKMMIKKTKSSDGEAVPITNGKRSKRSNRTTRMLLAVVILFLITETPQGILNLLSGLIEHFFNVVYMPLGDLMDIITLINGGINFVLYCTMSKQFRDTFIVIFLKHVIKDADKRKTTYVTSHATRDTDV